MERVSRNIKVGETEIEVVQQDGHFAGIGQVTIGGVPMRNAKRPHSIEIRDPNGVKLVNYKLVEQSEVGNAIVLRLEAECLDDGIMEWMLHEVRYRYRTADWASVPTVASDTSIEWILEPAERSYRGVIYQGYSYRFRYHSKSIPIYKILDRGTWEPGGSIIDQEFWMRCGTVPGIKHLEATAELYSSEWYVPSIQQPNIFQFLPLQTNTQGFTMTASARGTLLTRPTTLAHVRSLFEKPRGWSEMAHWHEHCGDLAHSFETSPMEVLWSAKRGDRTYLLNQWQSVREETANMLHLQAGMKREYATTYGVLEEWEEPDFDEYTLKALPLFSEAGVETIMIPSENENNMNTWGVSNMCCQVDFKISETVGAERIKRFVSHAKDQGIKVQMWGNTAISTLSYIFDMRDGKPKGIHFQPRENGIMAALHTARSPFVTTVNGAIDADHYTPVFATLNFRDPVVKEYWNTAWRELYDEIGISGIFIDSSFNMSSDKFTYRQNDGFDDKGGATIDQAHLLDYSRPITQAKQAIETQYFAYLEMLKDMQAMGYAVCGEDTGLFGANRSGPGVNNRMKALPLWQDSYCAYSHSEIVQAGGDPDNVYFRGLAFRCVWNLYFDTQRQVLSWKQVGGFDLIPHSHFV